MKPHILAACCLGIGVMTAMSGCAAYPGDPYAAYSYGGYDGPAYAPAYGVPYGYGGIGVGGWSGGYYERDYDRHGRHDDYRGNRGSTHRPAPPPPPPRSSYQHGGGRAPAAAPAPLAGGHAPQPSRAGGGGRASFTPPPIDDSKDRQ